MSRRHRAGRERRSNRHLGDAGAAGEARRWRRRVWVLAAAVAVVAVVLYLPAVDGFTNWDDPGYVTENPHLGAFDVNFLAWAFTTFHQAGWNPLTWISLGVDHALFRVNPSGYHSHQRPPPRCNHARRGPARGRAVCPRLEGPVTAECSWQRGSWPDLRRASASRRIRRVGERAERRALRFLSTWPR